MTQNQNNESLEYTFVAEMTEEEKIKKQRDIAIEALEFYAEWARYQEKQVFDKDFELKTVEMPTILIDSGIKASEALKQIKEAGK